MDDQDPKVISIVQRLKDVHKDNDLVIYELPSPRPEMQNYSDVDPIDRQINWKDAELFLGQLDPDQARHTFQTFFDNEKQKERTKKKIGQNIKRHIRVFHEDYRDESFREKMVLFNRGGLLIGCTINQTDFNGRRDKNIVKVRALVVDLDGAPLKNLKKFPLRPHALIESSPARYHGWYFVKDFPLKFYRPAQEALAVRCDGDKQVIDLCRSMRLPGTFHNKDVEHIYQSRLLFLRGGPRYAGKDVLTILGVNSRIKNTRGRKSETTIHKGTRNDTLFHQATHLVSQGKDAVSVREEILAFNQAHCTPPLAESEVEDIVKSATKKALPPSTIPRFIWSPELVPEAVDFLNEVISTRHDVNDVFQRGSELTFIKPAEGDDPISMIAADNDNLDPYLGRISEMYIEKEDDFERIAHPLRLIRAFRSSKQLYRATKLKVVTDFPLLRGDGSLMQESGYDASLQALYLPHNMTYDYISPEKLIPVKDELVRLDPLPREKKKVKRRRMVYVSQARNTLLELYQDFPFVHEYHRSVAVAFPLTGLAIAKIGRSPQISSSAAESVSGKSLILDVGHCIVTGCQASGMTVAKPNEEEFKKVLISLLKEGKLISMFDNLSFPFESDALCSALIQPKYQDRLLHQNNVPSYPTCTVFCSNGKNLTFKGDLKTRSIITRIDPKMENPGSRHNFKIPKLIPYVLHHRPKFVNSGLAWLCGYIKAGKPDQHLPHFARFDAWNEVVRSALVWLGLEDPCLSIKDINKNEVEDRLLTTFLYVLYDILQDNKGEDFTISELVTWAEGSGRKHEQLKEVLLQIAGKMDRIDTKELRDWIEKQYDKRRGAKELYLRRSDKKTNRGVTYFIRIGKRPK